MLLNFKILLKSIFFKSEVLCPVLSLVGCLALWQRVCHRQAIHIYTLGGWWVSMSQITRKAPSSSLTFLLVLKTLENEQTEKKDNHCYFLEIFLKLYLFIRKSKWQKRRELSSSYSQQASTRLNLEPIQRQEQGAFLLHLCERREPNTLVIFLLLP